MNGVYTYEENKTFQNVMASFTKELVKVFFFFNLFNVLKNLAWQSIFFLKGRVSQAFQNEKGVSMFF